MYQVVELCGNAEPWWFFDDWQDEIVNYQTFDNFEEALSAYKIKWTQLKFKFPKFRSQASLLSAFWSDDNRTWCEECGEELQEYTSLALLKNWQQLPLTYHQNQFEQSKDYSLHSISSPKPTCIRR